jgi:small subunit ribosomal protein S16
MALMIRLRQQGRKNARVFRLVVADKETPRDGKYIAKLGWYNPLMENDKNLFLDSEKLQYWIDRGAMMTEKAQSLVKRFSPEIITNLLKKKEEKLLRLKNKNK